ncbi:MAG: hypothetical protein US42_C0002G0070 [Candidatus Magasanikbacteria bacterium GW2011_GWC2_37_14]|uniref:Uncharacterized protein n=1 Tax=Candidatus Magasanikbacteria bacterium GW2011_GWC2_37_14 TaxID=1619046 RepID=A0A0G0GPP8_9BACT|nr:MAG: hypothetical protein US42_C0002G0070 [Candidatus Magasanikbacteria bacterium GW2011_GWC2_37_14]
MPEKGQDIGGGRQFFPNDGFLHDILHLEQCDVGHRPLVAPILHEGTIRLATHTPDNILTDIEKGRQADTEFVIENFDDLLREYLKQEDKVPKNIKLQILKYEDVPVNVRSFVLKRFNRFLRDVKQLNHDDVY